MSRQAVRTGCMRKDDSVCKGTKNPIKPPQHKDRQGIWNQAWPHSFKCNGHKVCAITEKLFEETKEEDRLDKVRGTRMQEGTRDRVMTPPRKK